MKEEPEGKNIFEALGVTKEEAAAVYNRFAEVIDEEMEKLPENQRTNGLRIFILVSIIYNPIAERKEESLWDKLRVIEWIRDVINKSEQATVDCIVAKSGEEIRNTLQNFNMDEVISRLFPDAEA